jgi:hypothetical protein
MATRTRRAGSGPFLSRYLGGENCIFGFGARHLNESCSTYTDQLSISMKGAYKKMKTIAKVVLALILVSAAYAAEDAVSALHGTVDAIDSGTRTIVLKTADGTRHSLRLLDETAVHGAERSAQVSKDSWHGLTQGSEVVAHYTKRGTEAAAVEIDKVGQSGLKTARGTVTQIDRGGKKLVVDTGDGAKQTFELTDHASEDAGKDVAKATAKGSEVAVYFTEDSGKKVAHFFEAM